jgi:hypothetical protein
MTMAARLMARHPHQDKDAIQLYLFEKIFSIPHSI